MRGQKRTFEEKLDRTEAMTIAAFIIYLFLL